MATKGGRYLAPVLVLMAGGAGGLAWEYGFHKDPPNWFLCLVFATLFITWTET